MKTIPIPFLIIIFLLAGCSSLLGSEPQPTSQEPKEIVIVMPENTSTSIKFRINTFQKHARLFETANSGVKVSFVLLPIQNYHNELLKRIEEKKPMDLVFGDYDSRLSNQGVFADLLPLYKADRMTTDDLYKPLVDIVTVKGKMTGVPMAPLPLAVFYNKSWFQKANLPEPKENWTWEQFFTMSAHLKEANAVAGKEIYGSALPMDITFLETLAGGTGSSLLSADGSKSSGYLNSRPFTEALWMLLRDVNNGKVVKQVASSSNPVLVELRSGNVGMAVSKSWNYSFLFNDKNLKGNIGVVPMPRLEKGVRSNAVYVSTISIAAASKQQPLAWKFIKDVVLAPDSEFQQDWSKQEMLTSQAAVLKVKHNAEPGMKVFYEELNYAIKPAIYQNPKLATVSISNVLKALNSAQSEAAVEKVLTEAAFDIDQQLSQVTNK